MTKTFTVMPKIKKGTYIVLSESHGFGCERVKTGTIGKLKEDVNEGDTLAKVIFAEDDCVRRPRLFAFRVLTDANEITKAERMFNEANEYRYATFN